MGCLCFAWVCIPVKSTAANALWCSVIGINLLVFIAAVIASSVFVFTNSVDFISCAATALPFGLTILSYVLLFIFGLLCGCSFYTLVASCED